MTPRPSAARALHWTVSVSAEHTLAAHDPFAGPAITSVVPTTHSQLEIWTATQMGGDAALAYNEAVRLRLAGPLDGDSLRQAIETLIDRHESLRAMFSPDGRSMLVSERTANPVVSHDLSHLPPDDRAPALAALELAVVATPFALELGPLARFEIVRLGANEHVLVIAAHHLVCDGWSFGVLTSELKALYDAISAGQTAAAADRALGSPERFSDYAVETRDSAIGESSRYWREQFQTLPDPLDLPSDRPRPPRKTFAAGRVDTRMSPELVTALRRMAAQHDASMFAALLAGFSLLMARLAGTDDLVVGVPAAGQLASGRTGLVGHCVNTIPLRLRVALDQPFEALLAQARTAVLDGLDHQDVGFGQIIEQLALPRDPSRVPLTALMFNVDRALSPAALSFRDVAVEMESIPRCAENFDLSLNATETDDGLALECQYNTGLFDAATVERWLASYERLLQAAVTSSATPVGRLAMRTPADLAALARCNDSAHDWPDNALPYALVEAQVERTPDAIAIEQDTVSLTYRELNVRANRLARALRAAGVGPGVMVGLYLERTPDMIVSLVAVLKAGGAYVPMDPALPIDRLRRMVEHAQPAAVITTEHLRADARDMAPTLLSLDGNITLAASDADDNRPLDPVTRSATDPAYVIFTSGSTGGPKGVVVPQGALANLLRSVQHVPGLRAEDTVLAVTTLSFDIAVSEVLLPLTVGARIVLATRDEASDGSLLRTLVETRGVTFIDATPATYRLLLAEGWTGGAHLRIICTGEALPRELAEVLTHCARELWNGYGPSETTVWSTFHLVQANAGPVLIGRPVANTVIDIRDPLGQTVPIGVAGELFIGGAGVATGYLGNSELTTERFTPDLERPGSRWYRTGDLVRLLPSGDLECLGRADDQVKIRGYRIEPAEIAAVASQWPGVRQAVVVARADNGRDLRLVAYIIADAATSLGDDFRAHLRRTLPEYMMPAAIVELAVMPLTASGKVDKRKLPAPDANLSTNALTFVPPRNQTERLLAELWQEALGVGEIGVHDDFFALGGHSLLAAQVLSRLRRDHGIELTFRRIFEAPTVEQLAVAIHAAREAVRESGVQEETRPAVVPRANTGVSPLTAQQERLWMLEELDPRRRFANAHPASWELTGPLDVDALRHALSALTMRHAMLRTRFVLENGERVQQVDDEVMLALEYVDLTGHQGPAQDAALGEVLGAQQAVPFALDQAPLMRVTLIALGAERHRLFTLQHGLVWDGWSFDLFLRDLGELYSARVEQRDATLPALPITFGDYAAWQQAWVSGGLADRHRGWWDERLGHVRESLELPADRPRPISPSFQGGQRSVAIDRATVDALQTFAHRHDSTLFMVILAAFGALLHRHTGQEELLIASPMRARMQAELEDVIGPFVNAVVLPQHFTPETRFTDALRAVRDTALDSYAHQELPFERLGGRLPAIRAVFSMQDARARPVRFGPLDVSQVHVPLHVATNELTLWTVQFADRMQAVMNYSTDILDDATIELLLAQLQAMLRAIPEAADGPIRSLPMRTEYDAPPAALSALDAGADQVGTGSRLLAAIEQIAVASPNSTAIASTDGRLTFGRLWERAGHMASGLIGRGLEPGDTVAIDVRRHTDRMAAFLGGLRAGVRLLFVPLDDGKSYRELVLTAAAPRLLIADGSVAAQGAVVTPAVLEQEGAAAAATGPTVHESTESGVVLAELESLSAVRMRVVHLARLATQAQALVDAAGVQGFETVLYAVPASAPAYVPALLALLSTGASLQMVDDESIADPLDLAEDAEDATCLVGVIEAWRATADPAYAGTAFSRGLVVGGGVTATDHLALVGRGSALIEITGPVCDAGATLRRTIVGGGDGAWTALGDTTLRIVDARDAEVETGVSGRLEFARAGIDTAWQDAAVHARRRVGTGLTLDTAPDRAPLRSLGQQIAPGTLEAILQADDGPAEVAVATHVDASGSLRLVAHVVPAPEAAPDVAKLREQWRARLPMAFLPARVAVEQALPLDGAGALLRDQLRSPFQDAGGHDRSEDTVPLSSDEVAVRDVWAALLEVPTIRRSDNFFRLGGTSLLCFRAIDALRERTTIRVSARTFLTGTMTDVARELAAPPSREPR